jgi:protoporphyrinogen IX oxidase
MDYSWLKALHVIAVISWMAGMLYLPRLFVYHADVAHGSSEARLFEVMEYRLLRYIMSPALVVVWLSGLSLAYWGGFLASPWMHAKFLLVLIMSGAHGAFGRYRRELATGSHHRTAKFFRIINEVPTVLMILVVILVIVKPFS